MNHFRQNSHFALQPNPVAMPLPTDVPHLTPSGIDPKTAAKTRTVDKKTLEDWAYRLEQCAYEAQDEKLLPLYSDLLDLRDEVVHLLHESLLD